jgi:hypothetical protein
MSTQASFPTETLCTCGSLTGSTKDFSPYRNTELTHQIGSLLIALGNIFEAVPLLRINLNPGTAQLLISIGRKLLRASGKPTRRYS